MEYNKNIYKFYLIIFFHNLIPAYVIERLFYQQRGITVFMVVFLEIIYAVTIVVLEVPTGILADRFGRKPLLVIGAVLACLEFVILLFAWGFAAFSLVALLAAVSRACTSGAFNALLYDSLLEAGREGHFEKVLGRVNALDFTGALLAALSGSLLADLFGFELNYVLSAASMSIALVFTILLRETPKRVSDESRENLIEYVKGSIAFYKKWPGLIHFLVRAMAIGACINFLDEFWQLYLNGIGIPILFFGVFSAAISLVRIPGNLIAGELLKRFREEDIIIAVLVISSIGFFVTAIFPGGVGIGAIVLIFLASGVVDPVVTGYIHHRADSEIRATIDSIQSLIERAIIFIAGLGFGFISSRFTLTTGFIFLGAVLGAVGVYGYGREREGPSN